MRFWRPAHKSLYVVPEVHGNIQSLEIILNRILPLRIFKNQEDVLVMLGDYIDGSDGSADVIDTLINIKKQYPERIVLLKGNHEHMMLQALIGNDNDFNYWIENNGIATITSYVNKYNIKISPYSINRNKLLEIIPKSHIYFLQSLDSYYILDNYVFFHGGFDFNKSIIDNSSNMFMFDQTASKTFKNKYLKKENISFQDDYVRVGSHNYNSKKPFINSKYIMLGGTLPEKMLIIELNSMSACAISSGKSRIYKYKLSIAE